MSTYPDGYKPRYWTGEHWVQEETAEVPGGITLARLPAWATEQGIPGTAEFSTREQYGQADVVVLTWLVPADDDAAVKK